jgi:regulatory protein
LQDYKKVLNYSFLLLRYRPRSKQEIIERLNRKKYPAAVIDKVMRSLEENRYINDEEFVRLYVSSSLNRGWGRKRIDYTLKKFGISEGLRSSALKNKQPFKEKLRDLVQKKISGKPRDRKAYQKIIRSLAAKGFDYEDIIRELEVCGFNKPRFSNE